MNILLAFVSGLVGNLPDILSDLRKPNNSKKIRQLLDANGDKKVNIDDLILYSKKLEEIKWESIAKLIGIATFITILINFKELIS